MMFNPMNDVKKRRQNTKPDDDSISQKRYVDNVFSEGITTIVPDQVPNHTVTIAKNIKTVKHVRINDPILPEVSHVLAPRNPQKESRYVN